MSRQPYYTDRDYSDVSGMTPEIAEKINASNRDYYKDVETEVCKDEKGFFLKVFVKGEHIGGLPALSEYKFTG